MEPVEAMPPTQTQSVDKDEWTTISRKGKRQPSRPTKRPGSDPDLTVEKLKVSYDKWMQTWQASACRKEVRQILDRKQPDDGWQIKKALCMATGSFNRDVWELQRRSMCQFVAFMDTVQHLQTSSSEKIRIMAQELIYTEVDNEFLSQMGVTVYNVRKKRDGRYLDHGGTSINDHLGPASFVFEPFTGSHAEVVQFLVPSQIRLLIGTAVLNTLAPYIHSDADIRKFLIRKDPDGSGHKPSEASVDDLKRVLTLYKQFEHEYSTYNFPRFEEDPNIFEGLRIAWRTPKDEDDFD